MSVYHAFISHKSEDEPIARALKENLERFSPDKLEVHYSGEISFGTGYRQWIEEYLIRSKVLIFLYTANEIEDSSEMEIKEYWSWCMFEIGTFHGHKLREKNICKDNPNKPIICIKHPDISKPPSPIEDIQVCDAKEPNLKKLVEQLIYEPCIFSEEPLVSKKDDLLVQLAVGAILKAFKPSVNTRYFEKRLVITLSKYDGEEIQESDIDDADLSGNQSTMRFLNLPSNGSKWSVLYNQFKARDQNKWLDQIRKSIERIKQRGDPIDDLQPFTTPDNKTYIPVITRAEMYRKAEGQNNIKIHPKKICVIFTIMPSFSIPSFYLLNMGDVIEKWVNYPPTSIVKIDWEKRSGNEYHQSDIAGTPYVCHANKEFADLWDFTYDEFLPNFDNDPSRRLTDAVLMNSIHDYVEPDHLQQFKDDQEKLIDQIIFKRKDDLARVPLQFNSKHRKEAYKNTCYLPYLISKQTIGDLSGPHEMYLLVCYVKDFFPLTDIDNHK